MKWDCINDIAFHIARKAAGTYAKFLPGQNGKCIQCVCSYVEKMGKIAAFIPNSKKPFSQAFISKCNYGVMLFF